MQDAIVDSAATGLSEAKPPEECELIPIRVEARPVCDSDVDQPDADQHALAVTSRTMPAGTVELPLVGRSDGMAIASAVCGLTAFVPVLSQLVGLVLGIIGLRRIKRAKRQGHQVGGKGWAYIGISSSLFFLLSWVAVFLFLALVGHSFASTTQALPFGLHHGG